jgi:AcrR family transcriptional regulator
MAEHIRIAKKRKPYELRARADSMDRTRARITRAAIELHGTIGPAATTMSAVAEQAGVTRATLYRHFPNEAALFSACSGEWRAANPAPDPAHWTDISDPYERLGKALAELYRWYRSSEAMRANLLRDLAALPPPIRAAIESYPRTVADVLDAGWPRRSRLRRAAIGHGVAFETWRSLAHEGLSDTEATRLIIGLVSAATQEEPRRRPSESGRRKSSTA